MDELIWWSNKEIIAQKASDWKILHGQLVPFYIERNNFQTWWEISDIEIATDWVYFIAKIEAMTTTFAVCVSKEGYDKWT